MRRYLAGLPVDNFEPERSKFRPILLMTHDLWVGGWCWHDWATRFCNLGWECWVINLRGRDPAKAGEGKRQTADDCVKDLRRLIGTATSPVILLAHGFGAWLALRACADFNIVAGVFLAPPAHANAHHQSRTLRLLRLKYFPLILLRQPIQIRATDFSALWLNCVEEELRHEILQGLVPESPHLVRAAFQQPTNLVLPKTHFPALVLGGAEDRLVTNESGRTLAANLGGEYREYPQRGRWMFHEGGWEDIVNDVHRWILKNLGESILSEEPTD
jgi:pimeloyl-ACP methyl ester carboxylesterase